jgi:hypothetical protein
MTTQSYLPAYISNINHFSSKSAAVLICQGTVVEFGSGYVQNKN